jgi:hypothetical protein
MTENDFTKINHDVNGNPRYVIHFLHLNTQYEHDAPMWDKDGRGLMTIGEKYRRAVKRANRIGGRKFHNKSYGGGIVFQSYSIPELIRSIERVVQQDQEKQTAVNLESPAWDLVENNLTPEQ